MAIERNFNISFVAGLALREKQIQQNYRPIIAVHKWFARRPGTLFRALVLSEFGEKPVEEAFFTANTFSGKRIADPFMGGGTPLIEANRVGCDVDGFDINPMAAWIVREEIEHLDLKDYAAASNELLRKLRQMLQSLYMTDCPLYGDKEVPVKYWLWVKEIDCEVCGAGVALFPGYLLAEDVRHPKNVLVCATCGELNEVDNPLKPGACKECRAPLTLNGAARRGRCPCPKCKHENVYPRPKGGSPRHRLFAIEYYNAHRKDGHKGRFFKKPDKKDLERYHRAEALWAQITPRYVPDQIILPGDETDRLHRWGYDRYRDLFNTRQLLGLELSAEHIAALEDKRVRHALATNLSDLLRYQNMLCRYDTMALKSLDIFSVHGFPVGLVQCESNFLGIQNGNGIGVGSGGWSNIIDKYMKAKRYCDEPFEVRRGDTSKKQIRIEGEWIGERLNGHKMRTVNIHCASSTAVRLKPASFDAVFTDPPYFGNVQYGELMDFCYVWLQRLVGKESEGFDRASTRAQQELTGNITQGRDLEHFTEGLSAVYANMAKGLKPGCPLVFTYHHNSLDAYSAIGVAILDAGFVCSATLPCPAEMGGSIHIHGTGSSIVDTVFVCREKGTQFPRNLFQGAVDMTPIVLEDCEQLTKAGMKPTAGDVRCITYGHAVRMAVWNLRRNWRAGDTTTNKLRRFAQGLAAFGNLDSVVQQVRPASEPGHSAPRQDAPIQKKQRSADAVSF